MNLQTWRREAAQQLSTVGIESASLDALVLLCDELGREKAWVLAHGEAPLSATTEAALNTKVMQRAQHIPLAYIRGRVEFYGREFAVNTHVLVPRPESESMIELLKHSITRDASCTIADIGTGSGALAITAKLELPSASVFATDIDERCLEIAQKNAVKLEADITFLHGDLLSPLPHINSTDHKLVILANLPYVPEQYPINTAASHEPALALFSGKDGLNHYARLFAQAHALTVAPSYMVTECLMEQQDSLSTLAQQSGYQMVQTDGLAQLFTYTA
jgi:release factor glutamine methyltransferase